MDKVFNKYQWLLIVLILYGCATNSGYKIKSFFFDGVPDPYKEETEITKDTIVQTEIDSTIVMQPRIYNTAPVITGSMHPPYKERQCFECHDNVNRGKAKLPLLELCFNCHDRFEEKLQVVHGPVESGNCTMCHSPHQSEQKRLLLSNDQSLCLQCHNKQDVTANTFHFKIEEQSCLACHNPHGGENRSFLSKEACLQCHSPITENKANLHGPVDAGECTTCHLPHGNKEPKLLVSTGNTLCLGCHDSEQVYSKTYHVKKNRQDCISCHDPHGNDQSFFLTKADKP